MGGSGTYMKIVFLGTPDYVMPILTGLHKKFVTGPGKSPISAVVTQSPKPTGRKQYLTYSPVDKWAHEHKIPTLYSAQELIDNPVEGEIGILAAYGEIIRRDVINLFPHGILVIHPSLLPKYRGASPIPAAIANGDITTGVSIIRMDEKVDHGKIIAQFKEDILSTDTSETLRARLFERTVDVLIELLPAYMQGKIKPKEQNEAEATYTKIMNKEDGFINPEKLKSQPAEAERFIRAMQPWPGAWTRVNLQITKSTNNESQIKRLKILKAHLENDKLVLDEVQLEGKLPTSWKQFSEGHNEATFLALG
jgi:methionyl-tRNA formyltransferase